MSSCCHVKLHVEESGGASLHVDDGGAASLDIGGSFYAIGSPLYTGSHDFTPTNEAQIIPIDGMRSIGDIVIEPIPSNYGRIAYSGAGIIVY